MRLLLVLLMLPFWVYFPIAAGLGYLAERSYNLQLNTEAEYEQAFQQDAPPVTNLYYFNKEKHISRIGEVHIEGWINPAYNYNLIKKRNFIKTGHRYMYLLFGANDQKDAHLVRAALMLTSAEKERFVEESNKYISGFTGDERGVNFVFNGFGGSSDSYSSLLRKV